MIRCSLVFISICFLAACENEAVTTPPPPPSTDTVAIEAKPIELPSIGPKAQTAQKAEIDWTSARADLAASSGDIVSIQSAGEEPADVPVLIPTGIVTSQSAESGPVFRRTDDGYFAFYPGDSYNIIVNGTNETVEASAINTAWPIRRLVGASSNAPPILPRTGGI